MNRDTKNRDINSQILDMSTWAQIIQKQQRAAMYSTEQIGQPVIHTIHFTLARAVESKQSWLLARAVESKQSWLLLQACTSFGRKQSLFQACTRALPGFP
jgi:hypothetical protein